MTRGADTLEGGSGSDTLAGGGDNDALTGGAGNDTYEFDDGWGTDSITELSNEGTDVLDFSRIASSTNLTYTIAAAGVSVSSSASASDRLTNVANLERIVGGAGANTYNFGANWASDLAIEHSATATGVTLDFSAYASDLYFIIAADGKTTVRNSASRSGGETVTAEYVTDIVGGKGNNFFKFEKGGSIAGNLTGDPANQTGTTTLDYSKYGIAVTVDLSNVTTVAGFGGTVSGIDHVIGTKGIDTLSGDAQSNQLTGGRNDDVIHGAAGADAIAGGSGDDDLRGDADADTIMGGKGGDYLEGGAGLDQLEGGSGNDTLVGGDNAGGAAGAKESLKGGGGSDRLVGGVGDDELLGESGDDTLVGGR